LITMEHLAKLTYTTACIKESMRIFPIVTQTPTQTYQDCTIMGHFFPKGTHLNVHVYGIHHDPDVFPEPEKMIPERWLSGKNVSSGFEDLEAIGQTKTLPELGFSWGTHACLGKNLAMLETKIIISLLCRHFTFQLK